MQRSVVGVVFAGFLIAANVHAQVADHLQCFKVTDPQAKTTYSADLEGLALQQGCTIAVPAKLECIASSLASISPQPAGSGGSGRSNGFTCYKLRCPRAALSVLNADDEFGTQTLTARRKGQLLCAPNSGPTDGGFPATGQTVCWDSGGNLIPCDSSGEDGALRRGAPLSYTDNGDGTITDNNTGLVWEKQSRDGSIHDALNGYTWSEAFSVHVATLNAMNFAGHSDWRVPNVKELASIVNYNSVPSVSQVFNMNCVQGCSVLTCSCTNVSYTWTSTVYANFNARGFFWAIDFGVGNV